MNHHRIVTGGRHRYGPGKDLRCLGAKSPQPAVSPRRERSAPDVTILTINSPNHQTTNIDNQLTPLDGTQPSAAFCVGLFPVLGAHQSEKNRTGDAETRREEEERLIFSGKCLPLLRSPRLGVSCSLFSSFGCPMKANPYETPQSRKLVTCGDNSAHLASISCGLQGDQQYSQTARGLIFGTPRA